MPRNASATRFLGELVGNLDAGVDWKYGLDRSLLDEFRAFGSEDNIRYVERHRPKRLSAPLDLYFDYTWVCNLQASCGQSFCYAKERLGKTKCDQEAVTRILNDCFNLGVMRVHLAGGEPTSEKSLLRHCSALAAKHGITLSLTTNGTLLSPEVIDCLIENQIFSVTISLDGPDRRSNDELRGKGVFDRAVAGIGRLIEARDKANSRTKVCLKPVFTAEQPRSFFEQFIELAKRLNVDELKLNNPERSVHGADKSYARSAIEYYTRLDEIAGLNAAEGSSLKISEVPNPAINCRPIGVPGLGGCIGGQELMAVHPDGVVTPCLMNDVQLGRIDAKTSLIDIIDNSEKFAAFRRTLSLPVECQECNLLQFCRGGSQTRKIVEYGHYVGQRDPLCPKKHFGELMEFPAEQVLKTRGTENFQLIEVSHSL